MSDPVQWPDALPAPLRTRAVQLLSRNTVTEMGSRRLRQRRGHIEIMQVMKVTWSFTSDQFDTFRNYFAEDLVHGSEAFEMDGETYSFLEPVYSFSRTDNLFQVSAMLEMDPGVETESGVEGYVGFQTEDDESSGSGHVEFQTDVATEGGRPYYVQDA